MPRPLCIKCGNSGAVIEWRLVWREHSAEGLVRRSKLVESAEEGVRLAALLTGAIEADVLSAARDCTCRAPRTEKAVETARERSRREREVEIFG